MVDSYLGEIRIFAGKNIPAQWAECAGQILAIKDNQPLFSLLGTVYGGNGVSTFALPDLRGRLPVGVGQRVGSLFNYQIGNHFGVETVTLDATQYPAHTHTFYATTVPATDYGPSPTTTQPSNDMMLASAPNNNALYVKTGLAGSTSQTLNAEAMSTDGGYGQAHTNVMPVLPLKYIISLNGTYPPVAS